MPEKLFDEKVLRKLEQLQLVANRVRAGVMKGERRSVKRGTSIEFADYRNYVRGDDLRRIDWNVFARLERPFIKLLEEEEDLSVYVLLDCSQSMNWPQEGEFAAHKFNFARRVVAGLAHMSLGAGDRLTIHALRAGGGATWGPYRGRGRSLEIMRWLADLEPGGSTDLNSALQGFAGRQTQPGMCILITDLFSPSGFQDGALALQSRGNEVVIVHMLASDEVNPPINGDLRLIDAETGQGQDVTVDAEMRDQYTRRLLAWRDETARYCAKHAIHYATVETDTPWEELLLFELRKIGVVH
jgi:uncharacterized protein (DUF58 family)